MEPIWIITARKFIGLKEIKGKATNQSIKGWLVALKAWWYEDETAWCGTFAAQAMLSANQPIPKHWYRAKDWLNWGVRMIVPVYGCVVVFERTGGGHVGFVVGMDRKGRLMVLGGNQADSVSIAPFDQSRVVGYRVPEGYTGLNYHLPVYDTNGLPSSTKES